MSGRNAHRLILLAALGIFMCGAVSRAADVTTTLGAAREHVRIQEEKAFAADPSLRKMQAWLDEIERAQQAADFTKLETKAQGYIDVHQANDELMSAYYALRGSLKQLAEHKNAATILKDAKLRQGWLALWRETLAKTRTDIGKGTSLARVEKALQAQMEAEDKDAEAKVQKLMASQSFPESVIQYVQRWAEYEARTELAQTYLNAKIPEELKLARRQLEEIERYQGEMLKDPSRIPWQKDAATTAPERAWLKALSRDLPPEQGPNVVILRELEKTYEAVPFDHKSHASMAQMLHGCETCHHRSPQASALRTGASKAPIAPARRTQEAAAQVPACKSCHQVTPGEGDIRVPSLKAAYHRQCLNCHKEWMRENACLVCHKAKQSGQVQSAAPVPGDIVKRMHPPLPEPRDKAYKMRFTPAVGGNVLFRHQEHTEGFGIKCVSCHQEDSCEHCHNPLKDTSAQKPLKPGMTWNESHGPCVGCHQQNHCQHCHYKDGQSAPGLFNHASTGQQLDKDHAKLACAQCHAKLEMTSKPVCGDAACHSRGKIAYPAQRPGPVVTVRTPAPLPAGASARAVSLRAE